MKVIKDRGLGLTPLEYDPALLARHYRELPDCVIADLHELCFGDRDTYNPDPRVSDIQLGMRRVWLHLNNYLRLTPTQIEAIYEGRGRILTTEDEQING